MNKYGEPHSPHVVSAVHKQWFGMYQKCRGQRVCTGARVESVPVYGCEVLNCLSRGACSYRKTSVSHHLHCLKQLKTLSQYLGEFVVLSIIFICCLVKYKTREGASARLWLFCGSTTYQCRTSTYRTLHQFVSSVLKSCFYDSRSRLNVLLFFLNAYICVITGLF